MATSLSACCILLSKEMGDFWSSAATSAGAAGGTTLVDTALLAKPADWIPADAYDRILSGTYVDQERQISSLSSSTLTVLAHGGQIASGVTYEVHRLFTASEKRRALLHAAKSEFPHIFKHIRDTSLSVGNWLRNGDMEIWGQAGNPDNWTAVTLTAAKNTTGPYYKRGATSCKLSGAAGSLRQGSADVGELILLAGKGVTFTAEVWSDTASCSRLRIYDGTTTTNSDYHAGGSKFEKLTVTATIADSPSEITVRVMRDVGTGIDYVDDARVFGPIRDKLYIGDLGLAQNYPHIIEQSPDGLIQDEPWEILRDWEISGDGFLYLPYGSQNYQLRVRGMGYLDFLVSGASSEDWAATIAIDSPQTEILIAAAIIYLYRQKLQPGTGTAAVSGRYAGALAFWDHELAIRRARCGMVAPPATVNWGVPPKRSWYWYE